MCTGTPIPEGTSTCQGLTCLMCQASLTPALRSDAGKRSESLKDTAKSPEITPLNSMAQGCSADLRLPDALAQAVLSCPITT